jgi:hypothetical protein
MKKLKTLDEVQIQEVYQRNWVYAMNIIRFLYLQSHGNEASNHAE